MAGRRKQIEPKLVISLALGLSVVLISLLIAGCGSSNAASDESRAMIEGTQQKVEAEQVMLQPGEVDCGVRADLWSQPSQPNGGKQFCSLLPAGRALHFDDDVVYADPGYPNSFVQVRGTFSLGVLDTPVTRDGPENNTRLIETKVGVKIDNPCFPNPLPLMGVKKGQFSQDRPPVLLFRQEGTWQLEKFVH